MRDYEYIKINNNEEVKFTELYYYNGPKLEVCDSKHTILVWNDESTGIEKWIYVECDESTFNKYISNKISLLKAIQLSEAYLAQRSFSNYEEVEILEKIENILSIDYHPEEDSFLNFDYYSELSTPYINFEKKNFKFENKKVTMSTGSTKLTYIEQYKKKTLYTIIEESIFITSNREEYAAA